MDESQPLKISLECYRRLSRTITDMENTGYELVSLEIVRDPSSIYLEADYGQFVVFFEHYLRKNIQYTIDTYGQREKI